MKGIVRFGLGCSIAFEILMTLAISLLPPKPGRDPAATVAAVNSLTPWVLPFILLAVGTCAVFVIVGRQWERMGQIERLLTLLPAIVPLILMRFVLFVAVTIIVIVLIIAAVALLMSGGTAGSPVRHASGNVHDKYGNRIGSIEGSTGNIRDKYGNRVGSVEKSTGVIRDKYGNRIGSVE